MNNKKEINKNITEYLILVLWRLLANHQIKEQVRCIKKALQSILTPGLFRKITFGTVHTFQGGERKVIIFSTT